MPMTRNRTAVKKELKPMRPGENDLRQVQRLEYLRKESVHASIDT